jgi:hypothetical protein
MLAFEAKAQLIRDEWGEVIPFSLSEKYKNLIDTSKINTRLYKSYDNDSLFTFYNKNLTNSKNSSLSIVGMKIDSTIIDFMKVSSKFQIDEGIVWIFRLESKTAEGFNLQFINLAIPEGGYFCVYSNDIDPPIVNLSNEITNSIIAKSTLGSQIIIEIFEPSTSINRSSVKISSVNYRFISPLKKKIILRIQEAILT